MISKGKYSTLNSTLFTLIFNIFAIAFVYVYLIFAFGYRSHYIILPSNISLYLCKQNLIQPLSLAIMIFIAMPINPTIIQPRWTDKIYRSSSILISFIIISFHLAFWIRDVLRENHNIFTIVLSGLSLLIFINSESILFSALFWQLLHQELGGFIACWSIQIPSSLELSFICTLLLSNCSVLVTKANNFLGYWFVVSFILASTFISLQLKELGVNAFYGNDSSYGSGFFLVTSFHFFHVLVGLYGVIVGGSYQFWGAACIGVLYWHFLEILWLFIYFYLYSSSTTIIG